MGQGSDDAPGASSSTDVVSASAAAEPQPFQEHEVLACSIDRWYDRFKGLTWASVVIPLSEEFVTYLNADGMRLPGLGGQCDDSSDEGNDEEEEEDDEGPQVPDFPDVTRQIESALQALGGTALPKLNWSAPKDAKWLNCGTMRCMNASEVFALLKGSDFVAHDLDHAFDHCAEPHCSRPERFCLVLRRWHDLEESGEFRCFVRDRRLLAISQRHPSAFFSHLTEDAFLASIRQQITATFEETIMPRFDLDRFAFDVYVGRAPRLRVRLIDFSPWAPSTDPLLYEWEELQALDLQATTTPELRVVRSESEVRHGRLENYHQMPLEVAQMGGRDSGDMEELFKRAENSLKEQQSVPQ